MSGRCSGKAREWGAARGADGPRDGSAPWQSVGPVMSLKKKTKKKTAKKRPLRKQRPEAEGCDSPVPEVNR